MSFTSSSSLGSYDTKLNKNRFFNAGSKIFFTFLILTLFRFGSSLPLTGIDQIALQQALRTIDGTNQKNNGLIQLLNMYSGGSTQITFFSLGILPYINASMVIDLLVSLISSLEKLQNEEGEFGRKRILFWKKCLTFFFALLQSSFLVFSIRSYFYEATFFSFFLFTLILSTGALVTVWLTSLIDLKGIGNGTSLFIFANIITSLVANLKIEREIIQNFSFLNLIKNSSFLPEFFFLAFFIAMITFSQLLRINIDVISAKQVVLTQRNEKNNKKQNEKKTEKTELFSFLSLAVLENEKKEKGLSIRLSQAGIFPIIIASNIYPFLCSFLQSIFGEQKIVFTLLYYFLIIAFNYFYTGFFWEPTKISEQLRKSSVSLLTLSPGKETTEYLEKVVQASSLLGGIFLCVLLGSYNCVQFFSKSELLAKINVSSLLILCGVCFEIQKTLIALFTNSSSSSS